MNTFENAKRFIYRNARPLDFALWKYHFENGSKDAVLSALSAYQNPDGGFAHAIEADCFSPVSSPIQTWAATEILGEVGAIDRENPIIKGILRYLDSGADFDTEHNQWLNVVPDNNDYPHAIWWEYGENGSSFNYNPTAALAGFVVKFADKASALYKKACEIAVQAVMYFVEKTPFDDMHVTGCFIRLYEYLCESKLTLVDMESFMEKLIHQVNANICRDTEKWGREYVSLPSAFIKSHDSFLYAGNEDIISKECELIRSSQLPDGSYPVTWQWCTGYKEFELAANWWKAKICIDNMRFLKEFDKI